MATPKIVMLAIECSRPTAMKAIRHHQMSMTLAASLRVRAAIHTARQTSMLQASARQNSCAPGAAFLALTSDSMKASPGPSLPAGVLADSVPPALISHENASAPMMLPTSDELQ